MSVWLKIKMFFASFWSVIFPPDASVTIPVDKLSVPAGFEISVYATGLKGARSLAQSESGILFVGNRTEDAVYALVDSNENGKIEEEEKYIVASDLSVPNGIAVRGDDLYIAEVSKILVVKNAVSNYKSPASPEVVYDELPEDWHHGWKYIAFGPDGWLYIPVGAPCNICLSEDKTYAAIHRLNIQTKQMQTVAHGVRNSVGFDWHPESNEFYFTDNGRDWLGDDQPNCELNRVTQVGQHFGYPFCHAGDLLDPEFGDGKSCGDYVRPMQNLGAHVAPLGMKFYTGKQFPAEYKNQIFIAEHGSWNRTKKSGYQISLVKHAGGKAISYQPFITGWLGENDEYWGRPVDILNLSDGSLLISDDFNGAIYKVSYKQ